MQLLGVQTQVLTFIERELLALRHLLSHSSYSETGSHPSDPYCAQVTDVHHYSQFSAVLEMAPKA